MPGFEHGTTTFLLQWPLNSTEAVSGRKAVDSSSEIPQIKAQHFGSCLPLNLVSTMATTFAPIDTREVVHCGRCRLVQFRMKNNLCRRCHTRLDKPEPKSVATQRVALTKFDGHSYLQVAKAIRALRQHDGLSQRQLARRMNVPRTYISKIENDRATPSLVTLERFSGALEVSMADLLTRSEDRHQEHVRSLLSDRFIAQLRPFVVKLDGTQRTSLMIELLRKLFHTAFVQRGTSTSPNEVVGR
jgi:transcriptional regulator with XRE-family HTH domain